MFFQNTAHLVSGVTTIEADYLNEFYINIISQTSLIVKSEPFIRVELP